MKKIISGAKWVLGLSALSFVVAAAVVFFIGKLDDSRAAKELEHRKPVPDDLHGAVMTQRKGTQQPFKYQVEPVLHEGTYPLEKAGEQAFFIPLLLVYPWTFGAHVPEAICDDRDAANSVIPAKISISVIAVRKADWLFREIQNALDQGKVEHSAFYERDIVTLPDPVVRCDRVYLLTREAWEVVKDLPHADNFFSFPKEKKHAEDLIRLHLQEHYPDMDVESIEIVPKDWCDDPQHRQ